MTNSHGDSLRWYEESRPKIHPKMNFIFQLSCHSDTCLKDMVIPYRNEAVGNIPVYQKKGILRMVFCKQRCLDLRMVLTIPMCYYFHVPVPSTSKLIVKMVFCFFALSCPYACTKASNLTVHLNSKCI